MSDYLVQWENGNKTVELELRDPLGAKGKYRFADANAIIPRDGEFMNQFKAVHPDVADWEMSNFDNSADYQDGYPDGAKDAPPCIGKVFDTADGDFPRGEFAWKILRKL